MAHRFHSSLLDDRSRNPPYSTAIQQSINQPPSTSTQNLEFFQGASNVTANDVVINQVARDQYNIQNIHKSATRTEEEEDAILKKLPHAIGAGHTSGNHKQCLEGTRTEVLAEIQRWEENVDDTFVYWLKGVGGCGKSTIAQTFAHRSSTGGRLSVSFFCSRDFDDRRDLHLIFPTLALHLALHDPSFRSALVPVILSNPLIRHDSLAVQFQKLIVGPLKETGLRPTITIDALDECKDKEPISELLAALSQHLHEIPFIKIFITGRPEDHIRSGFAIPSLRTKELPLHDVDSATVDSDIGLYVRKGLQEIGVRRRLCIRGPWPSENEIIVIIRKCSGFFIIASVIINFIDDRYQMPQDQLDKIIKMPNSTIYEGMSKMDVAYHQILVASFSGVRKDDSEPFDQFRVVVASIVLTFNPLSRESLSRILRVSSERIWMILSQLHSILIVPDSDTQPIRVCHKSFADFLVDPQRCRDPRFHMDAPTHHLDFGVRGLKLMNLALKRNICDLPRYVINKDVKDLLVRRERYVGAALAYACESWVNHLRSSAGVTDDIIGLVEDFFKNHFLSWLEVLSIEGNLRVAVLSLRNVKSLLTDVTGSRPTSSLLNLIRDCDRFVLQFFGLIEKSATHIYHSALSWSPISSLTRSMYQMHLATEVKLVNAIDTNWDACIKSIPFHGPVSVMAFSHNGTSLAVVSRDNVTILDTMTGGSTFAVSSSSSWADYAYFALSSDSSWAKSVAFSPDDHMLACGGGSVDYSVKVWNVETSDIVQTFSGHTAGVHSVAFSPCGTMIASGSEDETVRIWNISSGCCQCVLKSNSEVTAVCWSGARDQVISGSVDSTIRVWDVSQERCSAVLHAHTDWVSCVTSLPGSFSVASASLDGTLKVYDLRSGDTLRTMATGRTKGSVRLLNNGGNLKIVNASLNSATIWDFTKDTHVSIIKCSGDKVVISPDGSLVAASIKGDEVKIWSTENGNANSKPVNRQESPTRVSFAPDGQLVAFESSRDINVWDLISGKCIFKVTRSSPTLHPSIAFSPDSGFLAYLSSHKVRVVDVFNKHIRIRRPVNLTDLHTDIVSFGLSPNGSKLVSLSPSGIILWDLGCGNRLAHLDAVSISSRRSQIMFSVDGARVFIKDDDGDIRIWHISQAPLSNCTSSSGSNQLTSLPMAFLPILEGSDQDVLDVSGPRSRCRYQNNDEWIFDEDGRRILWVPPDWRSSSSEVYDKKVALRRRAYVADFSDVLSS